VVLVRAFRAVLLAASFVVVLPGTGLPAAGRIGEAGDRIAISWDDFRMGEFSRAVAGFEIAVAWAKDQPDLKIKALYGLATSLALKTPNPDRERAAKVFGEVLAAAPDGELAPWCMLSIARMKHVVEVGQDPDYTEVRKAYQAVIDKYPFHQAGEEAFIYQQSTYVLSLEKNDAESAAAALRTFLTAHEASRFKSPAWGLLAECSRTLGNPDEQLKCAIRELETREMDPTNPVADNAEKFWKLATLAEFQVGDAVIARKYYGLLVKDYPTDARRYAAEQGLLRLKGKK
jgi:tetratricopeptide (TPR) repeat protein